MDAVDVEQILLMVEDQWDLQQGECEHGAARVARLATTNMPGVAPLTPPR